MICSDWGWGDRRSIDGGGRERPPQVDRVFFFFFLRRNFRFAFLALKVASHAFTWKILISSAKINRVLRCSLSRELATGRARLRTAVRGAVSQLQLTEPKEQRVAQRGLCVQVWKSELKSSPVPAILLDMFSISGTFCGFKMATTVFALSYLITCTHVYFLVHIE